MEFLTLNQAFFNLLRETLNLNNIGYQCAFKNDSFSAVSSFYLPGASPKTQVQVQAPFGSNMSAPYLYRNGSPARRLIEQAVVYALIERPVLLNLPSKTLRDWQESLVFPWSTDMTNLTEAAKRLWNAASRNYDTVVLALETGETVVNNRILTKDWDTSWQVSKIWQVTADTPTKVYERE